MEQSFIEWFPLKTEFDKEPKGKLGNGLFESHGLCCTYTNWHTLLILSSAPWIFVLALITSRVLALFLNRISL